MQFAAALPLEQTIHANGVTETTVGIIASSETAADVGAHLFAAEFGGEIKEASQHDNRASSTFFSRRSWNSSWEPKGPKPNWQTPPADPNLN